MSDFRAKYHALHILQKLASGDASQSHGGGRGTVSASPRKPGIRSSDDILREKYAELAELMAVQHLEQRAVSTLQKMYLGPKKSERKPRRSRRRKDDGRRRDEERRKDDGRGREGDRCKSRIGNYASVDRDMMKPRPPSAKKPSRPLSASSNSSLSSDASAKSTSSKSSNLSNASRLSSASNNSRASSRSSASSTSSKASARSNSSRSSNSSKPVERHIVTIVEEEEEEEVVNQDEIEERGVVRFDEDLAKENEEEARQKKENTKRTRRVSFVLEAEAESSSNEDDDDGNDSSDDTLKDDKRFAPGGKDNFSSNRKSDYYDDVELEEESHDSFYQKNRDEDVMESHSVPRSKYIEIENSILREILSPRSPRRMPKHSPRTSEEHSPSRRTRSKSPRSTRRNTSPMRAWEMSSSLPLPERPKRDISPCDHRLSSTDNPDVKRWLRHKNALKRRQRKEELKKERDERLAAEAAERQKQNKHEESEHLYDTWLQDKEKVLRKQHKMDRLSAKEEKKREDEERAKREEMLMEKRRAAASAFGEKLPTPRPEKKRRRKRKQKKGEDGDKTFRSSNPFKGLTYDQWMRQKLDQEQDRKKAVKSKKKSDPELEEVIPNIAKERIQRATGGKGKRVDSGLRSQMAHEDTHKSDPQDEKTDHPRPYSWKQGAEAPNSTTGERSRTPKQRAQDPKRVGLQRPSTRRNRLSHSQEGSGRKQYRQPHRGFSPSSARPEPQGSESNDDHSERGAKLGNLNKNRPASGDRNTNDSRHNGPVSKALVKQGQTGEENNINLDPDDLSVFMTEAMS